MFNLRRVDRIYLLSQNKRNFDQQIEFEKKIRVLILNFKEFGSAVLPEKILTFFWQFSFAH